MSIRKRLIFVLFFFTVIPPSILAQVNPEKKFGALFKQVQLDGIFPDSKTFPDCIPVYSTKTIMSRYQEYQKRDDFDLKRFVLEHFQLPADASVEFETDTTNSIREHVSTLWPVLTRTPDDQVGGSLITLPLPYIVPGGRFREIYYWDSYFTMLGLQLSGEYDLIRNMVDNFAFLINTQGFIPNGNRTYYLSRSQPPFFSLMVKLLAEIDGESVTARYLDEMEKEYAFWMDGTEQLSPDSNTYRRVVMLDDDIVLNRYYDDQPAPRPESYKEDYELAQANERDNQELYRNLRAACESGWDFSSRWLEDGRTLATIHTTEIIPVDLNCLLYHLERMLAISYGISGQLVRQREMNLRAVARAEAILRYCWDPKQKFFADYDFIAGQNTLRPSLAAVYPLYFNIASRKQAKQVSQKLKRAFLRDGGLLTTLENTGQQWDAPNGWAPLQWMSYQGLRNYKLNKLAEVIADRWIKNNIRVYENTGKMVEKYNVSDITLKAGGGEYPVQDGFGWSNGVLLRLLNEED